MNKRYLLDTNAAIARIANNAQIEQILNDANEIFIASISLGELYYGAEKSSQVAHNLRQVEMFAAGRVVLVCDAQTARYYGRIHHQLRAKGRPIPQNDMWIAAIAMQHDLTLLTRDAHFNEVDGLVVLGW